MVAQLPPVRPNDATVAAMDAGLRASSVLSFSRIIERFAGVVTDAIDASRIKLWIEYRNPEPPRVVLENLVTDRVYSIEVLTTLFTPREIDEIAGIYAGCQH